MLDTLKKWTPPANWINISTFDAHTGGEPLRILIGGYPALQGGTLLERRRFLRENYDNLRTALMWEPRGHREMYGCIVTDPVAPDADFGVLFLHNEGYSTMCGHAIIALAKVAVEAGKIAVSEPETRICFETPAGLVTAYVTIKNGGAETIRFENVPSFVQALDQKIEVPGLGTIRYDLAFGGAFYAFVDAGQLGLHCQKDETFQLIEKGMKIKRAIVRQLPMRHPFHDELNFLYGTIFTCPPTSKDVFSRNVCIFADGQVDRSPTGTGVSARLAIHYTRGEINVNEPLVFESIVDSRFTGRVLQTLLYGEYRAIIPQVEGTAHIIGRHEFFIDPDDPLGFGFLL